jgi:hypothetical protein
MAFPAKVERWRAPLQAAGGSIPVEFMLAWIEHESGGRAALPVSSIGERGIFQIHPSEAEKIGLSASEFTALTSDAAVSENVAAGVKLVKYYMTQANTLLSKVGASWAPGSFWTLVKLFHGAPAVAKEGVVAVTKYLGRAPQDWAEFYRSLPNVVLANDKAQRIKDKVTGNATEIAQKAGLSTVGKAVSGIGVALVIGVLAFFGYRWFKGRA